MLLQNWWYTTLLNIKSDFCPPLMENLSCNVVVVGAGMAGLHAALRLAKAGKKIILLERNICGGSSTGKSAGFLSPDSELELHQLIRRYGVEGAKIVWSIPTQGVDLVVSNIKTYAIACDLQKQDSFFAGIGKEGIEAVQKEVEARTQFNLPYTHYDKKTITQVNRGKGYTAGIRYDDTYGINALLCAQGLKTAIISHGGRVFEGTEVTGLHDHTVSTHLGSVKAERIIFAIDKIKPAISDIAYDMYHAQTFLSISEPLEDDDIKAMFNMSNMMCWDSDLVYTYYRLTGDKRLLIGGGSALTTFSALDVHTPRIIAHIIKKFKKRFPIMKHVEFIQYWPGRIDTSKDLIPIVDVDKKIPHVQYVLGCVGLPWAAFCGDYAAQRLLDEHYGPEYKNYLSAQRKFLIPTWLSRIMGKMATFSLSHLYAKYLQKGY